MSLLELFCAVDDFWQAFEPHWRQQRLATGERQRQRGGTLSDSEVMTIMIHFHQARYPDFKTYYTQYVQQHLRCDFPHLISYGRFIQRLPALLQPLCVFMHTQRGACTGIAFIDSTALAGCDNRRIHRHRYSTDSLHAATLWFIWSPGCSLAAFSPRNRLWAWTSLLSYRKYPI
jgi:hypothetical protein